MIFEAEQKLVFIGDSITDAGRLRIATPYGDGYVNLVDMLLAARHPQLRLRIVNRGVSGNTVRDLAARWERDVLAEHPDWLSVMIGINDVWRAFGFNPHEAVPLPEYEATLRMLLHQAAAGGARLILMTPYLIEPDRRDPMRRQMDWYGEVVKRLAAEREAPLVDTQAAFDEVLQHSAPSDWSGDRVHPTSAGHAVIARAWLRAVGFQL
jgi:lysophospholipase L1-like esterase